MSTPSDRPVFLNLLQIRFPATAIVSIAHRVSGVWLAVSLPFVLYLFDLSVRGAQGFAHAQTLLQHPLGRFWLALFMWAWLHHLFAGLRFLLLDMELGIEARTARRSAVWTGALALVTAVLLMGVLW